MHNILSALMITLLLTLSFTSAADTTPETLKARYFDAARQGNTDLLEAFYNAGVSPDVADEKGYTALILSAYHGPFSHR